jgi:ABC-2 type transport system permease protein
MNDVGLTLRQVRYTNKTFWRNPGSAFFTFAFPLMFLVIFTSLLGSGTVEVAPGVFIKQSTYYVAAMSAFAVITASYTNVAISTVFQRDLGILKRVKGSPLPGGSYLGGRVIHVVLVSLLLVILTSAFGIIFYSAEAPTGVQLLDFLAVVVVGSLSFTALGLATTAIVPNADAAPPIVNAIILPLLFLSGIFIPFGVHTPEWIRTIARIFPVKHFADAMFGAFYGVPFVLRWRDVLVVAIWGVAGLILAVRFFTWEPRK